jgi:hypothetical protein
MTRHTNPKTRLKNHTVTWKEEEVPEEDRVGGGRSSSRGRGRSRGGEVICYACGKTRHVSWECLKKKKEGGGEAHISEAHRRNVEAEGVEDGTSLMLRKVLLKPEA